MSFIMLIKGNLLVSLVIALFVHYFIMLASDYNLPSPTKKTKPPIKITFAHSPATKPPKKAEFLAPDHQQSSNKKIKPSEISQQQQLDQRTDTVITNQPKIIKKQPTQTPVKIIKNTQKTQPMPISSASLSNQIVQLGQKIRYNMRDTEKPRIKFADSVSAYKSEAVRYSEAWRQRTQSFGRRHFPKIGKKKWLSLQLTMDVGIRADGSVAGINIIKSSGSPEFDIIAKRIVIRSSPFLPLPKQLLAELDILRIRNVWRFDNNSVLHSR